jgi:hypothetical protein
MLNVQGRIDMKERPDTEVGRIVAKLLTLLVRNGKIV